MACGHMRCAQLWPAQTIYKKRRGQIDRQMDIEKDRKRHGHICSTGPHWSPTETSVGINTSRRWTPTLETNTNTKITKGLQTTGSTDGQTYYTVTQGI